MSKIQKILIWLTLILFSILFFLSYYFYVEKTRTFLTVAFLDVGQGDAIFVESPNGNQILIDAGQTSSVIRELSSVLPFYDREIAMVLATHYDADHVGGIPNVFKRYGVKKYLTSFFKDDSPIARQIDRLVESERIDKVFLSAGDRVILDKKNEIYIDILWPPEDDVFSNKNDGSLVALLFYKNNSFILMGDVSKSVEEKIINANIVDIVFDKNLNQPGYLFEPAEKRKISNVDVLKVGHHGSKTSTSESFLQKIKPKYAVISAGLDNKFGHPHAEVVEELKKQRIEILETSYLGTIVLQSNGFDLWIK